MNNSLTNANVAGRYALVEAQQPGRLIYSPDATGHGHFVLRIVVELQSRLDEPDRVRRGGRSESGARGAQQMNDWRVGGDLSGCDV